MLLEWAAISAAVIPYVRKHVADTAAKLADQTAGRLLVGTYKRLLPDDKLLKANKTFVDKFQKELAYSADLPTLNADAYNQALRSFLTNDVVQEELQRPLDGESTIDWKLLRGIWAESRSSNYPSLPLPDDFDWEELSLMYKAALRKQLLVDPQYRSVLQAVSAIRSVELAERITAAVERLAPVPKSLDLEQYRKAVLRSYAHLKLGSLDADWTHYERPVRLGSVYVPQTVKRTHRGSDKPRDYLRALREEHRRRLQDVGEPQAIRELETKLDPLNAMDLVQDESRQRIVLLADPGLGKSTLLKRVALRWAEESAWPLTIMIELRRTLVGSHHVGLLEYMEAGHEQTCCLPTMELDRYMQDYPSFLLLDGLDELMEPERSAMVASIIRLLSCISQGSCDCHDPHSGISPRINTPGGVPRRWIRALRA